MIDQGKRNMVQIGMAAEYVRFSKGLRPLSGFHVEHKALFFVKCILF